MIVDMSKQDKTYEEIKRDREVLIDWIQQSEEDKAQMITKYEKLITKLELQVEELEAPKFTHMDAAKAEEMMISNTNQPVSEAYRNNPFWDKQKETEPNFEEELVSELNELDGNDPETAHGRADTILLKALNHLGYTKVTDAYNALIDRTAWWGCA